jgi:predicted phosphoadenosine phosphosulfate sulfurtransferase
VRSIRESLSPAERAAWGLHARSAGFARRLVEAEALIRAGLDVCQAPYVAFSVGKDSAVLAHLVMRVRPEVELRFIRWEESQYLDNYEEVLAAWEARCAPRLVVLDLARDSLAVRAAGRWEQLRQVAPCDGYFIGLRAEESRKRRLTLRQHGALYQQASGLWRVAPLAWWRMDDVAAYIVQHDLPMLGTYHAEGLAARTSARVPRDHLNIREQALSALRQRDPGRWNQLRQLLPEVAGYL